MLDNTESFFLKNKYTKWYMNIIYNSLKLNRKKTKEHYFEKHHIVPKSLGGLNNKENLILLTPKEHFIAHLLLTKMFLDKTKKYKMLTALHYMVYGKTEKMPRYNSKMYNIFKMEYINMKKETTSGKNHFFYGKKHSQESNNKNRISHLGVKKPARTETHKKNLSLSNMGKSNGPLKEEHKQKISESLIGKSKKNTDNMASKWKITFNGVSSIIINLKKFCEHNNLSYEQMKQISKLKKKKLYNNYYCEKIKVSFP